MLCMIHDAWCCGCRILLNLKGLRNANTNKQPITRQKKPALPTEEALEPCGDKGKLTCKFHIRSPADVMLDSHCIFIFAIELVCNNFDIDALHI